MKKRALATVLWFYCGWYAGGLFATVTGLSPILGPILGTAAAAIVGLDPRGLIWHPGRNLTTRTASSNASASAQTSI